MMTKQVWICLTVGLLTMSALVGSHAHAAAPYQGIYVIIDPYNAGQVQNLKTASQSACPQSKTNPASPFCGAANGIMLRMPWCDFQLYHINGPQNKPYTSCHYVVGFSADVGSKGVEISSTDLVSPCAGTYDVCSGHTQSVLGTALRYISQINTLRRNAGLSPLNLSMGMYAGNGTPQGVLDTVGYVDEENNNSLTQDPAAEQCYRLPLGYEPQYVTLYEQAMDQLVSYVQSQFPQGANIAIIKPTLFSANDLEYEMPGADTDISVPADVGAGGGPGPALQCSSNVPGAQVWLNAYTQNPVGNMSFSDANESALASMIGHEHAALLNAHLPNTLISIASTGVKVFPSVNCGLAGSGAAR